MALPAGTVLAGYRIERVLGSGGMGTVYLARHPTLPRSDALKVLSAELSSDTEFRTRFIREADLAATLNHPNIVTVYDRGETDQGQLWIAMQFIDGTDANAEAKPPGMAPARAVHVISEVAKALDYAHAANLLHRDVKPANFLLSGPPGRDERVYLADFGIARALDDAAGLTATGALMATASYAPPEAIEGRPVDPRGDIYSLGCSLFRLLTGRTPYGHLSGVTAVMMAHVTQPPPRVSELVPGLPSAIDDVIATAMAKNPASRYPSARALADAAEAALLGPAAQPTPAAPPARPAPPAPQPPPPYQPQPQPPGPDTIVTYPSGHFTPPLPAPLHRRTKRRTWIVAAMVAVVTLVAAGITAVLVLGGADTEPAYAPQTFAGAFGTTTLDHRPHAVAALGPGDADAVLSLGVQPVVMTAPQGQLPAWEQDLAHQGGTVLPALDAAAVSSAKPDVIIATGDLDEVGYAKLAAIAPVITRPADAGPGWDWQAQLTWIGKVLGRDEAAQKLIADAANQQNQLRMAHANFVGKTVTVVNYSDNEISLALRDSSAARYLEGIGFVYNGELRGGPGEPALRVVNIRSIFTVKTDVMVVARTDHAAGSGGYGGLPGPFSTFGGTLVVVDNPATIAALNTGGPAATGYLNTALVDTLADQIR